MPGEAFIALAPDGTKYWFDWLVVETPNSDTRVRASMLVTRIDDRFGNTQSYSYSGDRLVSIRSSDGREIRLTYLSDSRHVDTVTLQPGSAQPRVWRYNYLDLGTNQGRLGSVTRPDGTHWQFALQPLKAADLSYDAKGTCSTLPLATNKDAAFTGSITAPSGLSGVYQIGVRRKLRASVPTACPSSVIQPWTPAAFDVLAVKQVTLVGAGLPTSGDRWTFGYDTATVAAAVTWMDVTQPDQTRLRYEVSNAFDANEGLLKAVKIHRADGGLVRTDTYDYTPSNAGPFPASVGNVVRDRVNAAALTTMVPLKTRTTTQDGDSYVWEAKEFNTFAQATRVHLGNTIPGQPAMDLGIEYANDTAKWWLGTTSKVVNLADNKVIEQSVFDASTALRESWRFGRKVAGYTYDGQGRVASVSDGNGHTTQFQDYRFRSPQTIVQADAQRVVRVVDDFGQITSTTDPSGVRVMNGYDSTGRITSVSYPASDGIAWRPITTAYEYVTSPELNGTLAAGHWRQTTMRGNAQSVTYFDARMRPRKQVELGGGRPVATALWADYDWRGQEIFRSRPYAEDGSTGTGKPGSHNYVDELGRLVGVVQDSELGPLATTIDYLQGAKVRYTDPKGLITTASYQVMDEPSYDRVLSTDAPESLHQTVARNIYGQPLSLTQSGQWSGGFSSLTRSYVYDDFQRICRIFDPESGNTISDYDGAGNVRWSAMGVGDISGGCGREAVAAGQRIERAYDAMDRVASVSYPDGVANATFAYDVAGRMLSARTGLTRWDYAYNGHGLLASEALSVEGFSFAVGYLYDANATVAVTRYPDGREVSYAPDDWGRATRATSGSTVFANSATYLPGGDLQSFTYGNGVMYLAQSNARGQTSNITYAAGNGRLLYSEDNQYDANANLVAVNDIAGNGYRNRSFVYDGLDRLTQAKAPSLWQPMNYGYDALDNLRSMQSAQNSATYQYDAANRLTSVTAGGQSLRNYTYDNRGNATNLGTGPGLSFDLANRLTSINGQEAYVYDAFGRRVIKTRLGAGGRKTYYVYSSAGQLLYERDNTSSTYLRDYIYLGGTQVAKAERLQVDMPGAISFQNGSSDTTYGDYPVQWGGAPGATGYVLQERYGDNGAWNTIYQGTSTSYYVSGRQGGTYYYRVQACRQSTCGGWVLSAPAGVKPALVAQTYSPSGVQKGAYTLSWSPSTGATYYNVEEMVGSSGNWTTVASQVSGTSIIRPGNATGFYNYRVSANNAYGNRGYKGFEAVTVDLTVVGPPATPGWINPTGVISLDKNAPLYGSWGAVERATYYEWQIGSLPIRNTGTATNGTTTLYVTSGIPIRARACNNYGCSAWIEDWVDIRINGRIDW